MIVAVYNRGHNTVEAAERMFPPRRQTVVDVDDSRSDEVHGHRLLDVQEVDLGDLTVDQLRDLARDAGSKVSGTKAELVARLEGGDSP